MNKQREAILAIADPEAIETRWCVMALAWPARQHGHRHTTRTLPTRLLTLARRHGALVFGHKREAFSERS